MKELLKWFKWLFTSDITIIKTQKEKDNEWVKK